MEKVSFDTIVAHLKNSGFVFPGSQIYGGLANTWDFGPLGVELKDNIKKLWWKKFIQEDPNNVGIQSAILMNPQVWEASGHLGGFSDPLMDCKSCKTRHRADHLIENFANGKVNPVEMSKKEMEEYIRDNKVNCPNCGKNDFTEIREFNLMFKTFQGVTEDNKVIYLRPETAQGMFVNFKNVQRALRKKLPFGIGQIGKSFRNEITPGNFIFRTREFEQMELEFFTEPEKDTEWYQYWKDFCYNWVISLGISKANLRLRDHSLQELSHYSKATCDLEYAFPFGWGELWGIACRSDYDLKQHQTHSGENLEYQDPNSDNKFLAYCIEPAVGVERLMLMFICESYDEELLDDGESRIIMHLHPALAPYKACVMPLSKKLGEQANEVYRALVADFMIDYDDSGSIGKRYRRQDAIGTPYCITVDFDTLDDNCVTVRTRDSMAQERIKITELKRYIEEGVAY